MPTKAVSHKFNEDQLAALQALVDHLSNQRGKRVMQSDVIQEALDLLSQREGLGPFPTRRKIGRPFRPDRRRREYRAVNRDTD